MAFDKLLGDLGVMVKALPKEGAEDDANIQAAAGGNADGAGAGDGDGANAGAGDGKGGDAGGDGEGAGSGEGEGGELEKSFKVKLPDGTEMEAVDGAEMIKALTDRLESSETEVGNALGMCVQLIKAQGAQIEKLTANIQKLAGTGSGRKTLITISQKGSLPDKTLAKSEQKDGVTVDEFFAKADLAFDAKKISGQELSLAEACKNRGEPIPASIIQKVMGFQPAA